MKKSLFKEEQIIKAIKQHEAGDSLDDLCREFGISKGTFYNWKAKFGVMDVSEAQRLRALEDANRRLKQLVADHALDNQALRLIVEKSSEPGQ
jgi:putative transposase